MTTNKEYELSEIIDDSLIEIENAIFMLNEFIDDYEWDIIPTVEKASKYGTESGEHTKDEEISYRLLNEYKRIIKIIRIARDYRFNTAQLLKKNE